MSSGPGLHWLVVFRNSEDSYEIFDSLAQVDSTYIRTHFFSAGTYEYIETAVQPQLSAYCGQFSVYFIYKRLFDLDLTFEECCNEHFTADKVDNEKIVKEFIRQL